MSVDWESLRRRSLRPGGFGHDRVKIWPQLLNAKSSTSSTSTSVPHRDEHQISLDTSRSFVLYPPTPSASSQERESLQSELHDLIITLFRKRPKLSYFQGYHDIVSVIMLTLPKELQLICIEKLSLHWLRDSMGIGIEPVLGLLRVTNNLIKLADPEFASMLEQSTQLPFAFSNLLTLFSHNTPTLPLIQHVFDYLLCRPPIAVVYLAAAITLARKEEVQGLMEEDEDGMVHSLLSSLPALTDEPQPPSSVPKDPSTSPISTKSSPETLHLQPDETSTRLSSPSSPLSVHGADISTDTTVVADPESDSSHILTTEETEAGADQPPFSPLPDSDLTLIDSYPAETSDLGTKDREEEVDGLTTPIKQSLSPACKLLTDSNSSPAEAEVNADVNGEVVLIKSPPLSEEVISVDDPTSRDTPEIIEPTTPTKPTLKSSPSNELLSPHTQTSSSTTTSTTDPVAFTSNESSTLSLSSVLAHASHLQTLFPPSHPSLLLSQIMGPQSVVHTWSENFKEWPSDNEAEAMVLRMDLIVYPFDPDAENDNDDEDQSETKFKSWKRHHRKHSSKKPHYHRHKNHLGASIMSFALKSLGHKAGSKMERKTILAGAAVALGVAVAMYGVKSGRGTGSVAGLGIGRGSGGKQFWPWS